MSTRSSSKASILRRVSASLVTLLLAGPALAQGVTLPPAGGQYDSQLGGAYPPPAGTEIVSRDRADPIAPGLYNICYVNAFQTQPQETDWWLANHPDLLLRDGDTLVEDPNWPGEIFLDTSSEQKRNALAVIVGDWIEQCARDGYDAIEADNLDTYSRSYNLLDLYDNMTFATSLKDRAHALGLAFGQKNGSEIQASLPDAGFDFVITESCQVYDECGTYMQAYGPHVLEIEYTDTDNRYFDEACASHGDKISVIRRDRNLTIPGEPSYFYQTC